MPDRVTQQELSDAVMYSIDVVRRTKDEKETRLTDEKSLLSCDEQEAATLIDDLVRAYKTKDIFNGLVARVEKGQLGLIPAEKLSVLVAA